MMGTGGQSVVTHGLRRMLMWCVDELEAIE